MNNIFQPDLQLLYNDARFANLFEVLDQLHTAASEAQLQNVTTLNDTEMLAWLREFIYTAQETVAEIEKHSSAEQTGLRLVKKAVTVERQASNQQPL